MIQKVAYIGHPISGNVEENLADIRRIVKVINLTMPDIIPFVPYYVDVVSLDDSIPDQRQRGISNGIAIIRSGLCDMIILTGQKISSGMKGEINEFEQLGLPVFDRTALSEFPI